MAAIIYEKHITDYENILLLSGKKHLTYIKSLILSTFWCSAHFFELNGDITLKPEMKMPTLTVLMHAEYFCSKMQNTNKESEKKISI